MCIRDRPYLHRSAGGQPTCTPCDREGWVRERAVVCVPATSVYESSRWIAISARRYRIFAKPRFRQRRHAPFMARRPLIVRVIQPTWTLFNELALNIRTTPPQSSATESAEPAGTQSDPRPRHDDSARYEVPDYFFMRKVLQVLSPAPEDVVFDLGCGLGRFLCLAARRKVRKCVGVELRAQPVSYTHLDVYKRQDLALLLS